MSGQGSGDFRGVHYSEGTNFSIVIPSGARNPRHPALLDNCLVLGIPFDTIFDRRACFTPLALHAYGVAAFTPRFAALRAGGPVAMTLIPLDFVKHHYLDHSRACDQRQ